MLESAKKRIPCATYFHLWVSKFTNSRKSKNNKLDDEDTPEYILRSHEISIRSKVAELQSTISDLMQHLSDKTNTSVSTELIEDTISIHSEYEEEDVCSEPVQLTQQIALSPIHSFEKQSDILESVETEINQQLTTITNNETENDIESSPDDSVSNLNLDSQYIKRYDISSGKFSQSSCEEEESPNPPIKSQKSVSSILSTVASSQLSPPFTPTRSPRNPLQLSGPRTSPFDRSFVSRSHEIITFEDRHQEEEEELPMIIEKPSTNEMDLLRHPESNRSEEQFTKLTNENDDEVDPNLDSDDGLYNKRAYQIWEWRESRKPVRERPVIKIEKNYIPSKSIHLAAPFPTDLFDTFCCQE